MFMAPIIYESVYLSNANVFDFEKNRTYIVDMTILRKNLKNEMDRKGWNATVLSEKSGVPQPTIQRFLSGTHGDPRSSTIQKLAKGLGTSEAVLRGFEEADLPVPLYENIEKLSEDNRKLIEQMVNTLVQSQPKLSQKTNKNQLTTPTENVGGGVNLPVQSQQSQDQRGLTKTRPNQFEIDLAIEHERCVMVRHQEQMEANARYIELVKEKCQNNECYCEPPCENVETPLLGYMQIIEAVKK